VAYRKFTDGNEDVTETNVAPVPVVPQQKRQQVEEDPTLALLESLIESTVTDQVNERTLTPLQVAQKEITYYRNVPRELWPKFEETVIWWCSRQTREKMPCLAQVACALLAGKPSSGGLECDFGALKEIISPKRASISQGFVEIEMMMKINKSLVHSDPEKVFQLPNDKWKEYIPSRPVTAPIHDLPIDDTESDDDSWNIPRHNDGDGVYVPNDNMEEEKETGNEGESVLSKGTCDSSTRHNQQSQNHNFLLTGSLIPKKQRSRGPCPKSLSFHPNPCPCMFIVVFMLLIDSSKYSLLLLKCKK